MNEHRSWNELTFHKLKGSYGLFCAGTYSNKKSLYVNLKVSFWSFSAYTPPIRWKACMGLLACVWSANQMKGSCGPSYTFTRANQMKGSFGLFRACTLTNRMKGSFGLFCACMCTIPIKGRRMRPRTAFFAPICQRPTGNLPAIFAREIEYWFSRLRNIIRPFSKARIDMKWSKRLVMIRCGVFLMKA